MGKTKSIKELIDIYESKINLLSVKHNVLIIKKRKATILEMEDVLFHHNSAVLLPSDPKGPSSAQGVDSKKEQKKITGLEVIKAIYLFIQENKEKKLVIAGHTDRSGDTKYNFDLSELRALSVLSILKGERGIWLKAVKDKNKVEDYQQILRHFHLKHGWDCDPGEINNSHNNKTKNAVKNFQVAYNKDASVLIDVDGDVGEQTWDAIYDVYLKELAALMGEKDVNGLTRWRDTVKFFDDKKNILPCGESIPIDSPGLDGIKSQTNRRVEFIFVDDADLPFNLNCPFTRNRLHTQSECPIYNTKKIKLKYIKLAPVVPVIPKDIKIVKIDDHFAPGYEALDISYEIKGLSSEQVTLEISSPHYSHNPIFKQPLENKGKTDGMHKFEWWGNANCKDGPLKDRFINPLFAPFKVKLSGGGKQSEIEFKVLYAKIELEAGEWIADGTKPDESNEKEWLRYHLNKLGYFGGPFTSDATETVLQKDYLKRAIKLYKYRNKEFLKHCIEDETIQAAIKANPTNTSIYDSLDDTPGQFSDLIKDEIKANHGKRQFFKGDTATVFTDKTKNVEIYIPSLYYEKSQQFNQAGEIRNDHDKDHLNEPFIPIKAKILLLNKKDEAIDAPEAVGSVKIGWRIEDPPETGMNARYQIHVRHDDDVTKASQDTQRLKYMQDVQTWVAANAKYSDDTLFVKNAPLVCGGKSDLTKIFISHKPFKLETPEKIPLSVASIDWKKPVIMGRTGVNFIPSFIAGDSYRIIVDLEFKGLPNEADLKTWHKADGKGRNACKAETGIFTIWRDDKFTRIVAWPGIPYADYQLARIRQNYQQCYIDMRIPSAAEVIDITSVIDNDDYQEIIKSFQPKNLKAQLTPSLGAGEAGRITKDATPGTTWIFWKKFNLTKDCLYGRDLPEQKNIRGDRYEAAIQALFYDDTNGFVYKISDPMAKMISDKLRLKVPEGHIIVAFRPHSPINIKKNTGGALAGYPKNNFIAGFVSMGLADGIVTYDLGDNDRRGYVITHEFGHHNFLYHNFHDSAGDDNLKHHDTSDWNDIMTYPQNATPPAPLTANNLVGTINPLYCGKCNLRLRGWRIVANAPLPGSFPANS